jgi:hypothetical protein
MANIPKVMNFRNKSEKSNLVTELHNVKFFKFSTANSQIIERNHGRNGIWKIPTEVVPCKISAHM